MWLTMFDFMEQRKNHSEIELSADEIQKYEFHLNSALNYYIKGVSYFKSKIITHAC